MSELGSIARLDRVRVTYDGYFSFALADVNLEIRRGEIFGLIGPKGSGKSTTLNLLAGRLKPSEGKVRVFGSSPRRPGVRARLGYLPEAGGQPKPTGLRGLFSRWMGPRRDAGPHLPNPLQVERLLLKRPDILLLDEPFANPDPAASVELTEMIRKFAGQGKTVILANETLAGAMEVCDQMAIYFRGQIQAVGSRKELLARPDAIRILGPVLPGEIAQRILDSMRAELLPGADFSEKPPPELPPTEPAAKPQSAASPSDTVDHEKLKRLMKPP